MKLSKALFLLAAAMFVSLFLGRFAANITGHPGLMLPVALTLFGLSFIPRSVAGALHDNTPDLSALTTSFVKFGGKILRKHVNELELGNGITTYKGVKVPIAMTKLSAVGGPRPYSAGDNVDNAAKFTDRTLTVHQSKWDFDVDPEKFRNKYLNDETDAPFYEYILDQIGIEYMAAINDNVLFKGVYNANGAGAVDIADGWITIAAREVAANHLVPVAIGAINATNAVEKVEAFAESRPVWWRKKGFTIKCSYGTFDAYKKRYRALNTYGFNKSETGKYMLDGFANVELEPVSWITNDGLLGVVYDAMAFGTDGDRITVAASMRRNIIEVRLMMPVGLEYEDLDCIAVSDNLVA